MKIFLIMFLFLLLNNSFGETIELNSEDNWAPYTSIDKDQKTVIGLSADIVRAAFKSQGIETNITGLPYTRCLELVQKGKSIACFNSALDLKIKKNFYHHSTPLLESRIGIWVPFDSNETNLGLKNLEGKTVGIAIGYDYTSAFTENDKIKKSNSPSELSILKMLAAKRIKYGLVYEMPGYYQIKENQELKDKVKMAGFISNEKIYVSFSKAHNLGKKYSIIFEKGMKAIHANGTYKKLEDEFKKNLKISTSH